MIRPLDDRILVIRDDVDSITKGGIIIPATAKKKALKGTVVAVGKGELKNGKRIPLTCKVGDKVLFSLHAGVDIKLDKEYVLMKEEGVLGIVED